MKQKLGLACALMARPKVLLLDEPSVGVDPVSRQDLWRMVQALTDEGMAVVWSTAYLDEAERCESVLLLNQGKLLFDGPSRGSWADRIALATEHGGSAVGRHFSFELTYFGGTPLPKVRKFTAN